MFMSMKILYIHRLVKQLRGMALQDQENRPDSTPEYLQTGRVVETSGRFFKMSDTSVRRWW